MSFADFTLSYFPWALAWLGGALVVWVFAMADERPGADADRWVLIMLGWPVALPWLFVKAILKD